MKFRDLHLYRNETSYAKYCRVMEELLKDCMAQEEREEADKKQDQSAIITELRAVRTQLEALNRNLEADKVITTKKAAGLARNKVSQ